MKLIESQHNHTSNPKQSGSDRLDRAQAFEVEFDKSTRAHLSVICRSRDISATSSPVDVDVLTLGVSLARILRLDDEGVSTEVISLSLQKIGRQILGAVAVKECKSCAESRSGNARLDSVSNHISPSLLSIVDGLIEEVVEEQILQVRV